jgi:glycosyltransferase involved in cell wall biosynthesis
MRVLIYVGYQSRPFNGSTISALGLGGTEQACTYLANELAKLGHHVQVSGQVIKETYKNVVWNDEISNTHFDVVIAASYIHYIPELAERNITYDKSYFWVHNEDFFPWWKGEALPENGTLFLADARLTGIICLTEWHAKQFKETYNIIKPIHIIGNGIDPSTFTSAKKNYNHFIYSSAAERGLINLLNCWPVIRKFWPNAILKVFSPAYASSKDIVRRYGKAGVQFHGTVDQITLHKHMEESQFWLHPTDYKETYCITALEMQMCGVVPITSNLAALNETVGERGFLVSHETNGLVPYINIVSNLMHSKELVKTYSDKGRAWAKCQTWRMRALEWNKLITQ